MYIYGKNVPATAGDYRGHNYDSKVYQHRKSKHRYHNTLGIAHVINMYYAFAEIYLCQLKKLFFQTTLQQVVHGHRLIIQEFVRNKLTVERSLIISNTQAK